GASLAKITDEMDLLTRGTFTGPVGTFRQTAELTKTQRDLLAKLRIPHSKKIIEATPPRLPSQRQHPRLVTRAVTAPAFPHVRFQIRAPCQTHICGTQEPS